MRCDTKNCLGEVAPYYVVKWYWKGWGRWPFIKECRWCGLPRGMMPRTAEDRARTKAAVIAELERRRLEREDLTPPNVGTSPP